MKRRPSIPRGERVARTLEASTVHVWLRSTMSIGTQELNESIALLSSSESERCSRFISDEDRRDYAAGHALLRTTLSAYGGRPPDQWSFHTNAHGKPFIEHDSDDAQPLLFNLSHTRGLVACAVAFCRDVGVDVVSVDRRVHASLINRQLFSRSEIDHLAACGDGERQVRFVELWALKEAFAKAIGLGVAFPWCDAAFDLTEDGAIGFIPPEHYRGRSWRCALFNVSSKYRLAVVASGAGDRFPNISIRDPESGPAEYAVVIRMSLRPFPGATSDRSR